MESLYRLRRIFNLCSKVDGYLIEPKRSLQWDVDSRCEVDTLYPGFFPVGHRLRR